MYKDMTKSMRPVWASVAVAAALWFVMFSPLTAAHVNFWVVMTCAAVTLTTLSTIFGREWISSLRPTVHNILLGIAIAFCLWCVFWVGGKIAPLILPFASEQVGMIYSTRAQASPVVIATLLLLIIGPAEEIFWRGFVQRRLMERYSPNAGFLIATALYTLIHIWALNFMLLVAALVAGFAWGLIYRFFPQRLTALIISHALWDAFAFVILPF